MSVGTNCDNQVESEIIKKFCRPKEENSFPGLVKVKFEIVS